MLCNTHSVIWPFVVPRGAEVRVSSRVKGCPGEAVHFQGETKKKPEQRTKN